MWTGELRDGDRKYQDVNVACVNRCRQLIGNAKKH